MREPSNSTLIYATALIKLVLGLIANPNNTGF